MPRRFADDGAAPFYVVEEGAAFTGEQATRVIVARLATRNPHLVDTEQESQGAAAVFRPRSFAAARTTGPGPEHYGAGYGYASLGGASVAENIYYINGMNVTNFRNGLGASAVPFEFYDQFQLKTGGFGAEFGRATGGVINSVTKRGTNEWRFTVGGYHEPESLRGHVPNVEHPSSARRYDSVGGFDETDAFDLFVSAGGPLVQDRLLVYGIYDFRSVDERTCSAWGRLNKDVDDNGFWGLKADWLFTDNHRLEYTGFSDDTTVERRSFTWDDETGEVGTELRKTEFRRGGVNHIVACSRRVLGCWTSYLASAASDEREVARVDFERAIGEQHLLSFGADREVKTSFDLLGYSGSGYFLYVDVTPGQVLNTGATVPEG